MGYKQPTTRPIKISHNVYVVCSQSVVIFDTVKLSNLLIEHPKPAPAHGVTDTACRAQFAGVQYRHSKQHSFIASGISSMFMLKKIIAAILLPLPLALIITGLGLYLLWFTKRQRLGKWAATIGVLMIVLFSSTPVSNLIVSPLENHHPTFNVDKVSVNYVVVLGSGHKSDERLPVTSQISLTSLARLMEGIRIYRTNADAKLILSGWGGADPVPNAVVVANVAMALGVPKTDIIKEPRAKDTHDEAKLIKAVVGDAPFALATSSAHMPRAMALFRQQGMNPIPAPTDYLVKNSPNQSPNLQFGAYNLRKSESAIHEYLGLVWAKLRGQI